MQSRPALASAAATSATGVFNAVPQPEMQPSASAAQTLILATFLDRFEQKKEDAKRALRQQVDDVVDDLFHQLVNELVRVMTPCLPPGVVPGSECQNNSSTSGMTNGALERPNILMFGGQAMNGNSVCNNNNINNINHNNISTANSHAYPSAATKVSLSTTSPLHIHQQLQAPISSMPSGPGPASTAPNMNLLAPDPLGTIGLMNGCILSLPPPGATNSQVPGQKRDSPSKDLNITTRPSLPLPKHSRLPINTNGVKPEPMEEDGGNKNVKPEVLNSTPPPSVIMTSNHCSSTVSNMIMSCSPPQLAEARRLSGASTSTCTVISAGQHESATARVQHTAHSQAHFPTTLQSPPVVASPPTPAVAHAHQHHPLLHQPSLHSAPAPAHQSSHVADSQQAPHFDSSVIVSTCSIFNMSNAPAASVTSVAQEDAQPVNLCTSSSSSFAITPTPSYAASLPVSSSVVAQPPQPPNIATNPTSGPSSFSAIIDDYDCPDEEYSDSDCDCEQCVGVQICKVDVLDDDHDPEMLSKPLKKRLTKRVRTDDSDEANNGANHSGDNTSGSATNGHKAARQSSSNSGPKEASNGLSGLGSLSDCPPPSPTPPPMNGDFQGEDDGEEECSATFKTISIKCSQNDCLSMFKSKIERNQHLLTAHNILPYTCLAPGCNKGFDNVRQYGEHNNSEHADVSNWACPKCSKICPDHRMLCRHIYFYHQEGRFKCRKAKCNFVASFRIDVRKHSQLHTEMYACQFGCGKSFSHTHHRKRHERIHLRLKPFKCKWPNCGYSSEARSTIIRHIRIRHFNLPLTLKQQNELNIVDNRDPRDYMEILTELMN